VRRVSREKDSEIGDMGWNYEKSASVVILAVGPCAFLKYAERSCRVLIGVAPLEINLSNPATAFSFVP